jgi:hypothetical protein
MVTVDTEPPFPVGSVELTLAMNSGPLLRLQPLKGYTLTRELRQEKFGSKCRGQFEWQGKKLDFRFLGAHQSAQGQFEIHGLVMTEALLTWFETRLKAQDRRPMLAYQRQVVGTVDSSPWSFLRRVLGDKFAEPTFSPELEAWLGPGVCVMRPAGWTNLAHVHRVVGLLGGLPGATCGWCAFDTEKPESDEPLRFVASEMEPMTLDASWRLDATERGRVPLELADTEGESYLLKRRIANVDAKSGALMIERLARTGRRLSLEDALPVAIKSLPHMPMPVRVRDTVYLCERATFRLHAPSSLVSSTWLPALDVELSLRGLPTRTWGNVIRHQGTGQFSKWEESNKTRLRLASENESWVMMGDGGSEDGGKTAREDNAPAKTLVTESVTPYAARGENAGFYVKHQEKDVLVVEMSDLSVPRTHGGLQELNDNLEGPELTLNSRTIVVTGVAKTAKLNITGMRINGDDGLVEVFAEEKVRIKEKITVVADSTTLDHNVTINGTAHVKKDTSLGAKLTVEGDTKIKGKTDVGK